MKDCPEIIFWISRHELNDVQKEAILHLHQGHVLVVMIEDLIFRDVKHLAQTIRYYSKKGMIYAVAPQWQIREIQNGTHGNDLVLRTFTGYPNEEDGEWIFVGVEEVSSNPQVTQRRILKSSDLNWERSRVVTPANVVV